MTPRTRAMRWLFAIASCLASAICAAGQCLVDAAREQIGVTVSYDPSYVRLSYPLGDVPINRGVCTDVVIRAYREFDVDLQALVHEDMRKHFSAYPNLWGLRRTDRNIDHRRVPNLQRFFLRHGQSLGTKSLDAEFKPGDLVTFMLPGNLPHIGIISDRAANGRPLLVHNVGAGTHEEDVLRSYTITGHYRYAPTLCAARKDAQSSQ